MMMIITIVIILPASSINGYVAVVEYICALAIRECVCVCVCVWGGGGGGGGM